MTSPRLELLSKLLTSHSACRLPRISALRFPLQSLSAKSVSLALSLRRSRSKPLSVLLVPHALPTSGMFPRAPSASLVPPVPSVSRTCLAHAARVLLVLPVLPTSEKLPFVLLVLCVPLALRARFALTFLALPRLLRLRKFPPLSRMCSLVPTMLSTLSTDEILLLNVPQIVY